MTLATAAVRPYIHQLLLKCWKPFVFFHVPFRCCCSDPIRFLRPSPMKSINVPICMVGAASASPPSHFYGQQLASACMIMHGEWKTNDSKSALSGWWGELKKGQQQQPTTSYYTISSAAPIFYQFRSGWTFQTGFFLTESKRMCCLMDSLYFGVVHLL